MQSLKSVLMERDGMTDKQAQEQIEYAKAELHERLAAGDQPHDICEELFGLEPDFLMDLL